ncbi:MAG: hypothetical protein HY915_02415 [Desulfovibrio sp.]|nr:hypothetical protein [Desulfovibrio sp.]
MTLVHFLEWFPMLVLAIGNGALREAVFNKHFSPLAAHQLSCLTGSLLLGGFITIMSRWWPFATAQQALVTGSAWLVMTVIFEFAFGRFGGRKSWRELLADYDVSSGRLWILVLVTVFVTPSLTRML